MGRFGGAEKLTILHSINLKKLGFHVKLFYGGPIISDWEERARSEVPMEYFPFAFTKSTPNLQKSSELLKKLDGFDIVFVHHHVDPILAFFLAKFLKKRLVWYCGEPLRALWEDRLSGISYKALASSVRATSAASYGKMITSTLLSSASYDFSVHFLRTLDMSTARRYQMIIANSYYTKDVIKKLYHLDLDIPVVYPGVDARLNANPHADPNAGGSTCDYILTVGAMIPIKNYTNLLKAFRYLPPKVKSALKLVIIGDGPLRGHIQSLISSLGLRRNVTIKARVTEYELADYYNGCSFIVHPTLHEPFGLVPLEAALFGKPSIVSNLGGMKEFVTPEETGIVVNPLDPKEVAGAISRLIEDDQLAYEMGTRARDRVLKEFCVEKSTEKIAAILNETVGN